MSPVPFQTEGSQLCAQDKLLGAYLGTLLSELPSECLWSGHHGDAFSFSAISEVAVGG